MATTLSPLPTPTPILSPSTTARTNLCACASCDRVAIWHRSVESPLDFTLDLNLDPAADRGCGLKSRKCSSGKTAPIDKKEGKSNSRRGRVFNTSEPETEEEEEEEEDSSDDEDEDDEGEEPMAIDDISTPISSAPTPSPTPSASSTSIPQHPARVNLLEPEGIEANLCARHVEQLMRERLFLFGEDCKYSLWWFPQPDYTSAVWRTDEGPEGMGMVVGDPDLITLNDKAKAAAAAAASSTFSSSPWIPIAVPALDGENAVKKRKASVVSSEHSPSSSSPSEASPPLSPQDSTTTQSEVEADGIGEELKSLILSEAIEGNGGKETLPSTPQSFTSTLGFKIPSVILNSTNSLTSLPPARKPLRLFIGNNGVLTSKKRLISPSSHSTNKTRSRFSGFLRSSTSSSLRSSTSALKLSTSSTSPQVPISRQFAPVTSTHRVRWLRNREIGGSGSGSAPIPALFHRSEITKSYFNSSPLPPTLITASFKSRLAYRTARGAPVVGNETPPPVPEGTSGGGGGMGCDGPVRVWSNLKNISHLYHVVPLDQSEAEITLEELSHPEVFGDTRIGCSVQLLHRQGANRDQQTEEEQRRQQEEQQRQQQQQRERERTEQRRRQEEEERRRKEEQLEKEREAPQTTSLVPVRRSESATNLPASTNVAAPATNTESVGEILDDFYHSQYHQVPQQEQQEQTSLQPSSGSGSRIRDRRVRQLLEATATPPRRRPSTAESLPPTVAQFKESVIVRSSSSRNRAPSTPSRARLRRSQQQVETESQASFLTVPQPMDETDAAFTAIRMQRRRSTVSATALSALTGPQVKVVSTTTPLAYKRRGGEDLLTQLFDSGVHCRPRHKYVSFVDVPLAAISPAVGWPGLEEFLARFRLMCTMSGVAIVNESRDRRRRVFVGRSEESSGHPTSHQSPATLCSFPRKASTSRLAFPPSSSTAHRSLRHSSSSVISNATEEIAPTTDKGKERETEQTPGTPPTTTKSALDWILVRERATMIIDLRRPLTNYGSFWNEHYFRKRLSMPLHGTVLGTRSDPVFAAKNPDVISHYLGEANSNNSGECPLDLSDGRQPSTWTGSSQKLPPPLVPSDPTIVHQSYTLTFYPDLDGNFSASLEYLTLHSPNCSVSSLDHARRRVLWKRRGQIKRGERKVPPAPSAQQQQQQQQQQLLQSTIRRQSNRRAPTTGTTATNIHGYSSNVWRSIEDVVAALKVPESSKSTHTYKQDVLDSVIDLLKERTCNTLAQEELTHRLQEQAAQKARENRTVTEEPTQPMDVSEPEEGGGEGSTRERDEEENNEELMDLMKEFGLIDAIEEELRQETDLISQYRYGPPVRWTFLPSLQFYQTRISL